MKGSKGTSSRALTAGGRRAVLAVMALALMMVVAAVASLNVALPELARSTGATQSELQWIVDAYALVFAGLLLPAGALGDRFGRKPILLIGLLVFGAAAATAVFVEAPSTLIALRATMGIGAALVMPTTLSIITNVFPPEERGRAVGVWAGVAGGGAVVGLLLSGTLLEWFSWPAVFATSVVLAAVAAVGAIALVPSSRSSVTVRLDPFGALLSSLGLLAIVYSIIEAPQRGWADLITLSGFASGLLLLLGFVLFELRRRNPMLDPRLFARRGFGIGSLSLTLQFFVQFGFLFVALQYLQFVLGYSALQSGLALLPMALMLMAISPRAPRLAAHLGTRRTGAAGLALMGSGMFVFATLGIHSSYLHFATGAVLTGIGLALATAPATTAIVSTLPDGQQGIASAINDLTREVGGALGIAVLGSILNSGYRSRVSDAVTQLPAPTADAVKDSVAAALQLGPEHQRVAAEAQEAFVNGLSNALTVGGLVLAATSVLVLLLAPSREPVESAHSLPSAEATAG